MALKIRRRKTFSVSLAALVTASVALLFVAANSDGLSTVRCRMKAYVSGLQERVFRSGQTERIEGEVCVTEVSNDQNTATILVDRGGEKPEQFIVSKLALHPNKETAAHIEEIAQELSEAVEARNKSIAEAAGKNVVQAQNSVANAIATGAMNALQNRNTEITGEESTSCGPASEVGKFLNQWGDFATPIPATAEDLAAIDPVIQSISQDAADRDRNAIVQNAERVQQSLMADARADGQKLFGKYESLSLPSMKEHLTRSEQALTAWQPAVAQTPQLDSGDRVKLGLNMANARDKAAFIREQLEEVEAAQTRAPAAAQGAAQRPGFALPGLTQDDPSDDMNFTSPEAALKWARSQIKPDPAAPTSPDALVNRNVMFAGLPEKEQEEVAKNLKLKEAIQDPSKTNQKTLANGPARGKPSATQGQTRSPALAGGNWGPGGVAPAVVLHNGYQFGATGAKSAFDCSSFASLSLPVELRKGLFTTLDFRSMWIYRRSGVMPKVPRYTEKRAKLVKETALAFHAIDLYQRTPLSAGDLLVYRTQWETVGHVFIVKSYDRDKMLARVLEASQSAGTLRESEFSISLDPATLAPDRRQVRAGLFALRLRAPENPVCEMPTRTASRAPSSYDGSTGTAGGAAL